MDKHATSPRNCIDIREVVAPDVRLSPDVADAAYATDATYRHISHLT